ncbi:MAG TPA: hypothetical protein VFE34_07705 [Dongiaceae bacterium]|jgi:hypothetical protein|nr:hypothetical protein [Dongiaceae bacterium]
MFPTKTSARIVPTMPGGSGGRSKSNRLTQSLDRLLDQQRQLLPIQDDDEAQRREGNSRKIIVEALFERWDSTRPTGPSDIDIADGFVRKEAEDHQHQDGCIDREKQPHQDRETGQRQKQEVKQRLIDPESLDACAPVSPPVQGADGNPGRQQEEQQIVTQDEGFYHIHHVRNTPGVRQVADAQVITTRRPCCSSPWRTR